MVRPQLPVGTAGKIRTYPASNGYRAATIYRDYDGRNRQIERHGKETRRQTRVGRVVWCFAFFVMRRPRRSRHRHVGFQIQHLIAAAFVPSRPLGRHCGGDRGASQNDVPPRLLIENGFVVWPEAEQRQLGGRTEPGWGRPLGYCCVDHLEIRERIER